MSKKKFTAGMESLFKDTPDEFVEVGQDTLSEEENKKKKPKKANVKEGGKRKSSGKDFTDDLQAFLKEAFQESFEQQMSQERKAKRSLDLNIQKRSKKPVGGLDALIRSTVEPQKVEFRGNAIKQLTLTFDEEKIQKLKKIARTEKKYLRKVINDIVEEYIKEYEEKKGKIK
jgi:hypothetical protein